MRSAWRFAGCGRGRRRESVSSADLSAGEADGFAAPWLDGHGHECDGDLFAGGEELIHFACGTGFGRSDLIGEVDEVVGRVAHGGDDDDDLMAGVLCGDGAAGGAMDASRHSATLEPPNFWTIVGMMAICSIQPSGIGGQRAESTTSVAANRHACARGGGTGRAMPGW